jgi:hypothetical protein
MEVIKSLLERYWIILKNIRYSVSPNNYQKKIIQSSIPYFSQWESPELIDRILNHTISAADDPLWKNSGALTSEEYRLWSWNICGMACLKMILGDKFNKTFKTIILGKKCLDYGGYRYNSVITKTHRKISTDNIVPWEFLDGLFYKPFLKFIKKEFDLEGKIIKPLIIADIIRALSDHKYVIASVNPGIRDPKNTPKIKGGHLVLITGYDIKQKLIYIHNPSGFYQQSQEHFPVSYSDFEKYSAHRGVIIY